MKQKKTKFTAIAPDGTHLEVESQRDLSHAILGFDGTDWRIWDAYVDGSTANSVVQYLQGVNSSLGHTTCFEFVVVGLTSPPAQAEIDRDAAMTAIRNFMQAFSVKREDDEINDYVISMDYGHDGCFFLDFGDEESKAQHAALDGFIQLMKGGE